MSAAGPLQRLPAPLEVQLVRPVPGSTVRLLPSVAVLVCGLLLSPSGWALWAGVLLVAVAVAVRPVSAAAPAFALLVGVAVWAGGDLLAPEASGGVDVARLARLSALVLAVHAVLRLAALAGNVAWRARVEAGVLLRVARSVLALQLLVQPVGLAVVWLRAGLGPALAGSSAGQHGLRLLAVMAVVTAVLLVLPRGWLRRRTAGRTEPD